MEILTPKAFRFGCTEASIKKPGKKDLAIIVSECDAVCAGVFTTNTVKSAPVKICRYHIQTHKARAILVNSGNANACTGTQGLHDVQAMLNKTASLLDISPTMIYPCSTGVIGTPMPMQRILPALDSLINDIGKSTLHDVAQAIMTTDSFAKVSSRLVNIGGVDVTVSGICKGAGMICPNMATMLCFILTDALVTEDFLQRSLQKAVKETFNCLSVDGDMSTNDTVLMLANGVAKNPPLSAKTKQVFAQALFEVCDELAKMIAKDGEGASKLLKVIVKNASTKSDAHKAARAIANSLLVKTAIYGNDANWGRIMASLGYSQAKFDPNKVDILINGVMVAQNGLTTNNDTRASEAMKASEVVVEVDLHYGKAQAHFYSCDLTEQYIKINAEYRT